MPFADALVAISEQTGYDFLMKFDLNEKQEAVTITINNLPLKAAMERLLAGRHLTFEINESLKAVVLRPAAPPVIASPATKRDEAILILAIPRVRGQVVDTLGNPLWGATITAILADGTRTGLKAITNSKGNFGLDDVPDDATLEISFIGYVTRSIKAAPNVGVIVLKEVSADLEEVIINKGYYTESKRLSTGNVARVTAEEISGQPVSSLLKALQGRMAGVEIIEQNGVPGAALKIQIRGQNSLRPEANNPLYIIDGVPVTSDGFFSSQGRLLGEIDPLSTINPENIESIDVLKDADATAIYGSRGANGVVLITTKQGKGEPEGKTSLEFNIYQGAGKANKIADLMNSKQYLAMRREAFKNDNEDPTMNPYANNSDLLSWDTTRYTDWQDVLFGGTANTTDVQAVFSGGSATTTFRFGTGYHKETMVFPGDFGYQRVSGNLNANHRSKDDKFSASITTNYSIDNNKLFDGEYMYDALLLSPAAPALFTAEGDLNWEMDASGRTTWVNPLANTRREQKVRGSNFIANSVLNYEIFKGLALKANLGYTSLSVEELINRPLSSYDPTLPASEKRNSTTVSNRIANSWIAEPQITYRKAIADGKLDVIIGTTWQASDRKSLRVTGQDYPSDELLGSLASASQISLGESNDPEYRYNAIYGRLNYNWKDKYLMNLTARRDGSSRFGPDNKYGNFWAVGLGWIFTDEEFISENLPFINFGKLRGSYGTTGSDAVGDYGFLDTYAATDMAYQGQSGLYPYALSNPNYAWEINKKLEAGLELAFVDDRISFSASWYRNRSSNQLVGYPLPVITGFPSVTANLPATVQNTGLEFLLYTRNIQSNHLTWHSSINLTIPRNKLLSYPNIEASSYANQYIVGEPLDIVRAYKMTGIDTETGLYQFQDFNNDGFFSIDDMKIVKNMGRNFYGGVSNSVTYVGFELNFLLEFVKQVGRNAISIFGPPGYGPGVTGAVPLSVLNRWQKVGDVTNTPKFTQSNANYTSFSRARVSDISFGDASFLRLKTIGLGYNFPSKLIRGTGLASLKGYLQGQNLLTFTNYVGFDPQSQSLYALSALKVVSIGMQFSF